MKRLKAFAQARPKLARWITFSAFYVVVRAVVFLNSRTMTRPGAFADFLETVVPVIVFNAGDVWVQPRYGSRSRRSNWRFYLIFFAPTILGLCLLLASNDIKQWLGTVQGILIYLSLLGFVAAMANRKWILRSANAPAETLQNEEASVLLITAPTHTDLTAPVSNVAAETVTIRR